MTIQHIVAFTWKDGTPQDDVDRIAAALRELAGSLPGVESFDLGPDLELGPTNASFGIAARFADEESFLGYREHPTHHRINAELVGPHLAAKSVLQFRLG